jgi:carbamoyltransferase
MRILGLTAFNRDAAAAIVDDGVTIAAAAEERFTRVKHDAAFPRRAVRFCLGQAGISAQELDWVVFAEKPSKRFERLLAEEIRAFPKSWLSFPRVLFPWFGDRLWVRGRVSEELGVPPEKVLFSESQRARAANAYYNSPFDDAAVLVADEALEWAATTLAHGKGNDLEILAEISHPNSLGLLAATASERLGLGGAEGIGRLFALAGCGEPRFAKEVGSVLKLESDGSYEIDPALLERAISPAREPGGPLLWTDADRRHADLAASVVRVLGDALLHVARELHRRVPVDDLCFGGTLAGSADLNARLIAEGPFKRLFVPPAPGDAGSALGAALAATYGLEKPARKPLPHAFLGEDVLEAETVSGQRAANDGEIVERLAGTLAQGKTAGWVRGRFEWGARALGHRTILASPLREGVREYVAASVKRREPFLPLCCAVPAERASEFFDVPAGAASASRFLQLSTAPKNGTKSSAPAVLHVDQRARPHLVDRETDPLFHALLVRFGEQTGVPILLTTSLNQRGDPIARGEADALAVLQRSQLDLLVVQDRIHTRS